MNNVRIHPLSVAAPQSPMPPPTCQQEWKTITIIAFVAVLFAGLAYLGYRAKPEWGQQPVPVQCIQLFTG